MRCHVPWHFGKIAKVFDHCLVDQAVLAVDGKNGRADKIS